MKTRQKPTSTEVSDRRAALERRIRSCRNADCEAGFVRRTDDRGYRFLAPCPQCQPRVEANTDAVEAARRIGQ